MHKRIIAIIAFLMLFFVNACGGPNTETSTEVQSLNGSWTAEGFKAEITDNHIVVNWDDKETDTTSLYWDGTFPKPMNGVSISKGDVEKMSSAILASGDKEKKFSYKNGEISYKLTVMGTTRTITLKKE